MTIRHINPPRVTSTSSVNTISTANTPHADPSVIAGSHQCPHTTLSVSPMRHTRNGSAIHIVIVLCHDCLALRYLPVEMFDGTTPEELLTRARHLLDLLSPTSPSLPMGQDEAS